jgi:perosamine synthetase
VNNLSTITIETPESLEMAYSGDETRLSGIIGTFMGRDALSLAVSYLELTCNDTVLLPAYLCQEVLRPFEGKTRVAFYDVQPDLTADPNEIRDKLKATRARVMLVINYFGFVQPYLKDIKKICSENETFLIEDCAHSLLTQGSGETGDLSVYSFRKILPLTDGGGLKVNMQGKPASPKFYPKMWSTSLSLLIMAKKLSGMRSEAFSRAGIASCKKNISSKAAPPRRSDHVLPMSTLTRRAMTKLSFAQIAENRRNDYHFWQEISARSSSVVPIFAELAPEVCPMGFPVKVKDRDSLKSRALNEGVHLSIYWRLPSTVGGAFCKSQKLAAEVLALPINPELDKREREVIVRLIMQGR